jgi:transcriptional/translational regulatory protein YebC/TACO1
LGATGCVTYLFEKKGVIVVGAEGIDEDKLMGDALESGAADFEKEDGAFEIFTDPALVSEVADKLAGFGYLFLSAEAEMIPSMYVQTDDPDGAAKLGKLFEHLEEHDDVINVWHNWENGDE